MRLYYNYQLEPTFHKFCDIPLHITFKGHIMQYAQHNLSFVVTPSELLISQLAVRLSY